MFLFFKQKTAYEMRISDWSSDVCSSDLRLVFKRHEIMRRQGALNVFPDAHETTGRNARIEIAGEHRCFVIDEFAAEPDETSKPQAAFNAEGGEHHRLTVQRNQSDGGLHAQIGRAHV